MHLISQGRTPGWRILPLGCLPLVLLMACTPGFHTSGPPKPILLPARSENSNLAQAAQGLNQPVTSQDRDGSTLVNGPTGVLSGQLLAPARITSADGSRLLSNNGSFLLSNNGAAILGNNGNALITEKGGSLIGKTKFYGVRQAAAGEPQRALTQALLYLMNGNEQFYRDSSGRILSSTVNASGVYQFTGALPVGKDVIVQALLNDNLRLTGFVVPGGPEVKENLNLGSTLATEFLRGDAYRQGRSLADYNFATFQDVAKQTQAAIVSQAVESVRIDRDEAAQDTPVARFDLRADQSENLRNQYVVAFSAASVENAALKALSDAWKILLGARPTAITSILGSGEMPRVEGSEFTAYGFAEGDTRDGSAPLPARIPLGYNYSVATSPVKNAHGGHDVFIGCATPAGNSGHIRWLRLDKTGTLKKATSLWLPTYGVGQPLGLCLEPPPTGDTTQPGSLLVADPGTNRVYRVYLVDEAVPNVSYLPAGAQLDHDRDPATPDLTLTSDTERYLMEIVAGEGQPAYADPDGPSGPWSLDPRQGYLSQAHPLVVDAKPAVPYDPGVPARSGWRFADEGARAYANGKPVKNPGRYAHLDQPWDVTVDEVGNIYIADKANHRIRFIPKAGGQTWFDYQKPTLNANQEIAALSGQRPPMVAGAIYTIAGNPRWDPARCPVGATGWFGDYGGDGGPAQLAQLDQPFALAWNNADKCLYVADFDNQRIRKISRETGLITTVVGNPTGPQRSNGQGDFDYAPAASPTDIGEGGAALKARLSYPRGLAFDRKNRLYVADSGAGLIRYVDENGNIHTVAGRFHTPRVNGSDNARDGDARHYADLYDTEKIAIDLNGNVVLQDYRHGRLRQVWRQWEQ